MSIEYGFESPLWMSKAIITHANPVLLKLAVCQLMEELWQREHIHTDELFDRLLQVSTVGKYTPPDIAHHEVEEALRMADDLIERQVQDFKGELDNLPTFTEEEHKKFLRDLGIPDESANDEDD